MGDPWAAAGLDRDEVINSVLTRWREFRAADPVRGDDRFRGWLFTDLAVASSASEHSFAVFEMAMGAADRDRIDDAFLILGWLGEHYAGHPDPSVAWPVIMGVTDDCAQLWYRSPEHNLAAQRVLRVLVDRAGAGDKIQRAACRALVQVGLLRSSGGAPGADGRAEIAAVWAEVAERWRDSRDPELRGRMAQALVNLALLALQSGDEPAARRWFAETLRRLGDDPSGVDEELDGWVAMARYSDDILDRLAFGEPEFQLNYLRRQQHWYPSVRMEELIDVARRVHTRATCVVRSWACAGAPFVLLLRNFELTERSGITTAVQLLEDDADHVQMISFRAAARALQELDSRVPVVQVANTASGDLDLPTMGQFAVANRIYLPNATWFETVSSLIGLAGQVIVWANELTPSLHRELAELVARGRTGDTLIMVEPYDDDVFGRIYLPRTPGEPLTVDHPALAAFPHRVNCSGLKDKGVEDAPALLELVDRLREIAGEPMEARLARTVARLPGA